MIIIVLILDIGGCRVSLDDSHPNYSYVWFIFIVNSSSTDRILDFAKPLSLNFQFPSSGETYPEYYISKIEYIMYPLIKNADQRHGVGYK